MRLKLLFWVSPGRVKLGSSPKIREDFSFFDYFFRSGGFICRTEGVIEIYDSSSFFRVIDDEIGYFFYNESGLLNLNDLLMFDGSSSIII